jgi:hypothetical protein
MIGHRSVVLFFLVASAALSAFAQPQPPIPIVTVVQTPKDALVGGDVTFCIKFRNASPVAAGYGPFIDLVFPAGGADWNQMSQPCDGATFVSARVTSTTPAVPLLPESPASTATPCGSANSPIPHPYAGSGVPPVTVPTGQNAGQLVVLPLPFGSFEPNQPEMTIEVTAHIHPLADLGFTLPVYVRGGFRYGADALDNNPPDPPVLNAPGSVAALWPAVQNLTPAVVVIHKEFPFPDDETVTGPNFVKNYKITVDVAPGQTVTNLKVNDCIPPSGIWGPAPPGGTILFNCLTLLWPSITGGSTLPTATSSPQFWITNSPALNPLTACSAPFINTAVITGGSWTPNDPRDLAPPPVLAGSASKTITKRALAIQKSAQPVPANAPTIPGVTIHNTLRFQVSDYLRFGSMVITDTLSAGQQIDLNTVKYRIKDRFGMSGYGITGPFAFPFTAPHIYIHTTNNVPGFYSCPPASANPCAASMAGGGLLPGGTEVRFDLSAAMIAHSPQLPFSQRNGILTGGFVGSPLSSIGAEGEISFDVMVTDVFLNPPPGDDGFLDKDDPLLDTALFEAKQYQNTPVLNPPVINGASCKDVGNSCLSVPGDHLTKEVVAINGMWQSPTPGAIGGPNVTRGDTVTYRLRKTIPSGDAQNLTIRDWYPLPVFLVPSIAIAPCPASLTFSPQTGHACWRGAPATASSNPDNSITYTLGTFNDPNNQPLPIEILATLTVTNDPLADGLLLTNEAQECETDSYGTQFCQAAIAQIKVQEPSLKIRKSILCSTGCGGPSCPTTAPSCPRILVTSGNVASLGVSSVQASAADRITFVVSIENTGTGPNGAFDVKVHDLLGTVQGSIVSGSMCVTNGAGTPMSNTTTQSSLGWSIELDDHPTSGSLAPSTTSTPGANIALIVFDVLINSVQAVTVGRCDDNTSFLDQYSNREGGSNFVTAGFPTVHTAAATVCIGPSNLTKTIVTTSEPHTLLTDVTIGEIVRYDLTFDVPAGVVPPITVTDSLPADLQMDPSFGPAIVTTTGFASPLSWVANSGISPSQVKFVIPSFVNAVTGSGCKQMHVQFNALVMNTSNNHQGDTKSNVATLTAGNITLTSLPVDVHVVEPKLTITKILGVTGVDRPWLVTVTNTSSVTAFDVIVSDTKPPCFTTLAITGVIPPTNPLFVGGNIASLAVGNIAPGQSVSLVYTGVKSPPCSSCADITNTATVTWTSLPGLGTCSNPTTSCTPGMSGASNGERNGNSIGVNNYTATATSTCFPMHSCIMVNGIPTCTP